MRNKSNNLSVQRKLFLGMLLISVFVTVIVTGAAVTNTYEAMKKQLIYNRRMSSSWLKERLELEVAGYQDQFYNFEVNQEYREMIQDWCIRGNNLDYEASWTLITAMNEMLSLDNSLNSVEMYNLKKGEVLIARRTGAKLEKTDEKLEQWYKRGDGLQSNLVFLRTEDEILVIHQMHSFLGKETYAMIVMHMRPYKLINILEEIRATSDESVIILNDEGDRIESCNEKEEELDLQSIWKIAERMMENDKKEVFRDGVFWFHQEVANSKLQILLSVPNGVITDALKGTLAAAVLAGFCAIIFDIFAATLFSRIYANPIVQLSKKMRSFTLNNEANGESSGDGFNTDTVVKNEIIMLQESFDIMVERNRKLIMQTYQKELETREAQIHALQAQINPHFLYNIMHVIGGMAMEKEAPEIYKVTVALGDILRYCLNFSRETVKLREELSYLRSYCMLQNERFDGRINLEIVVDDELLDMRIPKLILQPILENSFHHGLIEREGSWKLKIQGKLILGKEKRSDILELEIMDNGGGITPEHLREIQKNLRQDVKSALRSGAHIGLGNVNARIRLICPEEEYGVFIASNVGEGTVVTIKMEAKRGKDEI